MLEKHYLINVKTNVRFTISTDLVERNMIWMVTGITFAVKEQKIFCFS